MQHCPVCGHTPSSPEISKKSVVVERTLLDAFNLAFDEAVAASSAFVEIEHVLLALTKLPAGARALSNLDIDSASLAQVLTLRADVLAQTGTEQSTSPATSKSLRSLLSQAEQGAQRRNDKAITVSDIIDALLTHHASSIAVSAIENARTNGALTGMAKSDQILSTEFIQRLPPAPAPTTDAAQTTFDTEFEKNIPNHSHFAQPDGGERNDRLTHLEQSMAHQQRELADLRTEFSNGMNAVLTNVQAPRSAPENDDRLIQMISAMVDRHVETLRAEIRHGLSQGISTTADNTIVDRLNAMSSRLETSAKSNSDAATTVSTAARKDTLRHQNDTAQPLQRYSTSHRPGAKVTASKTSAQQQDDDTHNHPPVFYLEIDDDVVDAPSIGPKTAERLRAARIFTVRDLFEADLEETAEIVAARHITPKVLTDWQDQARLVCTIPALRGTHAQLLVGAGYRSASEMRSCDANAICESVTAYAKTSEGQGLLRQGPPPTREKIMQWVENAHRAQLARVA